MKRTALAFGLMLLGSSFLFSFPAMAVGPTVSAPVGTIRGLVRQQVFEFRGIPYAKPPKGDLRWRPPQPLTSLAAPLDATKFGQTCAQVTGLGFFAGPPSTSEDCLFLNVFTTGPDPRRRQPVLVWIHGGGFVAGESDDYDASRLARGGAAGPVVVVTFNYRLGLLGWFSHPALDREGHAFGNYGLMDQQAVLRWVRRNIAAFGGNPDNVTIAGQSAGALGVQAHLTAPASRGLFHRAIIQSEPFPVTIPLSFGEKLGADFAKAANCRADADREAASCLRSLSARQLLTLQGNFTNSGPYVVPAGLVVDGTVIPQPLEAAYRAGAFAHVPVLNGVTLDEGAFEESTQELFGAPKTASQYIEFARATFTQSPLEGMPSFLPNASDKLLARYPLKAFDSPVRAAVALRSDWYVCAARHLNHILAEQIPLWTYAFAYRDAPWYAPEQSFPHGAVHTIDLQFLFPGWHGGPMGRAHDLNAAETKLSETLIEAWVNFIYYGDPNGKGAVFWPRYQPADRAYLIQNLPRFAVLGEEAHAQAHHCAVWDEVTG